MYERNDSDIHEIQYWLQNQKFLPHDLDSAFIHTFLWGCQGNKEKTKKVLGNYFYARQSIPEVFFDRDPNLPENLAAWKNSCFVPLKGKVNGCRVYLGTPLGSGYNFVAFAKQMFMCYDLLIKNNEWENGDRIIILSYDNVKQHHVATFNLYITRKMAECERDNYLPGKLRAVHNVHVPPFMKKIHERFQPYLSPEDEKLIMFHKNLSSLHEQVNSSVLPLEFGGRAGPLQVIADEWYGIMVSKRKFYVDEEIKRKQEAKGTRTLD